MTAKEMQKRIKQLERALIPFAKEADTWSDKIPNRYRPGVTEPGGWQAHAQKTRRATFSRSTVKRKLSMVERPTDAEFEELKRKRDDSIRTTVDALCKEYGWDRSKTTFHSRDMHGCYCACPEGPCQHKWDGPTVTEDNMVDTTCSLCGASAFSHDMRCGE